VPLSDEVIYLPREIKGLERSTILIHGMDDLYRRALMLTEDEGEGNIPRFEARRLFDEMRVALSRSTDRLILFEAPDAAVLQALRVQELDGTYVLRWEDLVETLQTEEMSEIEVIEGYLREVEDLLEREMWGAAYARNRRSYRIAARIGDRALEHEADVQYLAGMLQEASTLLHRGEWQAAEDRNRIAREYAVHVDDASIWSQLDEQRKRIEVDVALKAQEHLQQAKLLAAKKQFEEAYREATAATSLSTMLSDASLRQSIADAMADTCWAWASHLVDSGDSEANSLKAADLLAESARVLESEQNLDGAGVLWLLHERYRQLPQRSGHSDDQLQTLLSYVSRHLALLAGAQVDPDGYAYARRWIGEAYAGLGESFTLYYQWANLAQELGERSGDDGYRGRVQQLAHRLQAILERAGQMSQFWDDNVDLARFRALATGVDGDHVTASQAWEALDEPVRAAEEARLAGEMPRAYSLYRQAKHAVPEELAIAVKLIRLVEQLQQKHDHLRPQERLQLAAELQTLQDAIDGGSNSGSDTDEDPSAGVV
jgi:hypothetical protein